MDKLICPKCKHDEWIPITEDRGSGYGTYQVTIAIECGWCDQEFEL